MVSRSLHFAALAEQDLTEIALYIAADNPARALSFHGGVACSLQDDCRYPEIYRLREEYGQGVRVAVHGRYLIFYAEREPGIVVIERILHGARHLDWIEL
ncbi:type II toxin-antitoxin system RelE/ParE family toxin [Rhizobium puerariae]|uniref:Type II toxin-antitoxin system RelE/ParE family toxin n=1 Tax=Rhizobium puerariae TaxID=1585791 RepID=A0ABV6AE94_9HYPH